MDHASNFLQQTRKHNSRSKVENIIQKRVDVSRYNPELLGVPLCRNKKKIQKLILENQLFVSAKQR